MNNTLRKLARIVFWYLMADALLLGVVGVIPGTMTAAAQTSLTVTTLSAAVSSRRDTTFFLSTVTGITANQTALFIDGELSYVTSVNTTAKTVGVVRGVSGTPNIAHVNGAYVFFGPQNAFVDVEPVGSCTRSNLLYVPIISTRFGRVTDCIAGQYVTDDYHPSVNHPNLVPLPPVGGVAVTSLETAGTAPGAATEEYCTEIDPSQSQIVLGLGALNGTTVGTDKHIVILRDSTGILLANSATAGTTTANASTYQKMAFTQPYYLIGPGKYLACLQSNGTTDTIRHLVTAFYGGQVDAFKLTGQTFGTIANPITNPGTFTTVLGPYWALF